MNTFYTLIKISTNPSSGDQITVGLLLKTKQRFYLKFSERKINLSLRLYEEDERFFNFFKAQLENKVNEFNMQLSGVDNNFFHPETFLTSDFFSHLNKSSNNLVQFSEPSIVSGDFTEEQFNKLYEIFVEKLLERSNKEMAKDERFFRNVEEKLIRKVENKIHTNYDINSKIISTLNFSFRLDCIGKNGSIISAKSLDFNSSSQIIERNLIRYEVVLSNLCNSDTERKAFLIADEPENKKKENYNIWETINKKSDVFEIVNSEEADKIAHYIDKNSAKKFLPV